MPRNRRKTDLANSSSPRGIFRSRQRMTWFTLRPELSAMMPAISRSFVVRSRWGKDVDLERNSVSAIAPAEVIEVDDKNSRFRAVFSVNAVQSDWIWDDVISWFECWGKRRSIWENKACTPSKLGPEHGFLFRSSITRLELYFWNQDEMTPLHESVCVGKLTNASAMMTRHRTSSLFSLRFETFRVRFCFNTWVM